MSQRIRLTGGAYALEDDRFTTVADDEAPPPGDIIVSFTRFQSEGDALLAQSRTVGVRLTAEESVDDLAYDLPRIGVVALEFPKYRDGRAYTGARLLRERYHFAGEIRAVGDVLREQAPFMVRCGFDGFEPADGSSPQQWADAAGRYRHVYQRAADDRTPVYAEREGDDHAL